MIYKTRLFITLLLSMLISQPALTMAPAGQAQANEISVMIWAMVYDADGSLIGPVLNPGPPNTPKRNREQFTILVDKDIDTIRSIKQKILAAYKTQENFLPLPTSADSDWIINMRNPAGDEGKTLLRNVCRHCRILIDIRPPRPSVSMAS